MNQRPRMIWLAAAAMLVLAGTQVGWAAAPPGPWISKDIGAPAMAGSTDVDASGVWTLTGSGDDIWNYVDRFQYAYQSVKGDGSITAQIMSSSGGDANWRKAGLMIRANDSDGSPNVLFATAPGPGPFAHARLVQGEQCVNFTQVGLTSGLQPSLLWRLQRVGSEVAGFYSRDGQIWTQAGFSPVTLPALGTEALFGLALTAHQDGKTASAKFAQVNVQAGVVSAFGVLASGADGVVQLQWHALPEATGFNVYRGPASLATGPLVQLNSQPVTGTSYTDSSAGLVNGTPVTYVIAPLLTGADGAVAEGPRVAVAATPVAAPAGWFGCSINEGPKNGSVKLSPANGQITIVGAGGEIWNCMAQGYFYGQLVQGDFRITVRGLTNPQSAAVSPRAGLMIREALDGTARDAAFLLTPSNGLMFMERTDVDGWQNLNDRWALTNSQLKLPVTFRLTRQGNTITPEISTDGGTTFQPGGDPLTFDHALPSSLYVGLSMTSNDRFNLATAKFDNLEIKSLQP